MKLTTTKAELLPVVATLNQVINHKNLLPAYHHIKVIGEGQTTTFMATNCGTLGNLGIAYTLPLTPHKEGQTLLPAQTLLDILKHAPDGQITIEVHKTIQITTEKTQYTLATHDPSEFANVQALERETEYVIPAHDLRRAIQYTLFAASKESGRYALNSVLFELEPHSTNFKIVATNGKKLAVFHTTISVLGPQSPVQSCLVPLPTLAVIERAIQHLDPQTPVHIIWTQNFLNVYVQNILITSTLNVGVFPAYAQILPKQWNQEVLLNTEAFLTAVQQTAITTDPEKRHIELTFTAEQLKLASYSSLGESTTTLPISGPPQPITITLDPFQLKEFLTKMQNEPCLVCHLRTPDKPVFFTCPNYLFLLATIQK